MRMRWLTKIRLILDGFENAHTDTNKDIFEFSKVLDTFHSIFLNYIIRLSKI